jgi:tRNA A-37 threonylcarbamoyl transferase component Bud32
VLGGRYRLVAPLGSGASGEVYLAEHDVLKRQFAVKVMSEAFQGDASLAERFRREARAASRLSHPSIVTIVDFGRHEADQLYLVMEYVEGPSLRDVMEAARPGPLPLARSVVVLHQLADALGAAHGAGVVHRDLKPENLVLTKGHAGGEVLKILDFGLAKILEDSELKLTRQGEVFGTPAYMSPEQGRGDAIDARADLYAFGVLAFELVTGRLPFPYSSIPRTLLAHQQEPPPRPSALRSAGTEQLPAELERLILWCLEKAPELRPSTAADLLPGLRAFLPRPPDEVARTVPSVKGVAAPRAAELDWGSTEATLASEVEEPTFTVLTEGRWGGTPPGVSGIGASREVLWARAVKSAKAVVELLGLEGARTDDLRELVTGLAQIEERAVVMETEITLASARIQDLDALVAETESSLRYAIMDLSAERGRLVDSGQAAAALLADLDFQLRSLETRLAEVYREKGRKLSELQNALELRRERLGMYRQEQSDYEVRLLHGVFQAPPPRPSPSLQIKLGELGRLLEAIQKQNP